jgi:hypothetical protein
VSIDHALSPLTHAYLNRSEVYVPYGRAWEELAPDLPGHERYLAGEAAGVLRVAPPERTLEGERAFLVRAGFAAALLDDVMVGRLMRMLDAVVATNRADAEFVQGQPALAMLHALSAEARRPERASFAQALGGYFLVPMTGPPVEASMALEENARVTLVTLTEFVPAYALTIRAALHVTRLADWSIPRLCAVDPTPPEDPIELMREARRAWDTEARRPLLALLLDAELSLVTAWTDGRVTIDAEGVHIEDPADRTMEWLFPHLSPTVAYLELASRHVGISFALHLTPRLPEQG